MRIELRTQTRVRTDASGALVGERQAAEDAFGGDAAYPDRRPAMQHSMKMMWGCVAAIVIVAILAATGSGAAYLLFALPCALMMGAMLWMMMRGMGGGSRRGR
jgi:choline-glycine betaine transporter